MAKAKKPKSDKPRAHVSADDPLREGIDLFARGDYARAKVALAVRANDSALSEGQREHARELVDATHVERGTLWVGIACVGLLVLVIVVTALTQP